MESAAKHLGIFSYCCKTNARILPFVQNDMPLGLPPNLRRHV